MPGMAYYYCSKRNARNACFATKTMLLLFPCLRAAISFDAMILAKKATLLYLHIVIGGRLTQDD